MTTEKVLPGLPTASSSLRSYLDEKVALYNSLSFITNDPISIAHRYSKQQDVEIAGLFAATLAWGNRTTIIKNTAKILELMGRSPHDFIVNHKPSHLKPFTGFVHRTFNATDLLYFIYFLQHHFRHHDSLEDAFVAGDNYEHPTVYDALATFNRLFFSLEHPERTRKHVPTPVKGSACKRLNMYLRWMVRHDDAGVDFGLWKRINPTQLICPLDVHVARVSYHLGLLPDERSNWANACYLTDQLRLMRPEDPVIYDFALFSIGVCNDY